MTTTQTCFECEEVLPLDRFPHFVGVRPPYRCITCRESGLKRCSRCLARKSVEDFDRAGSRRVRKSWCRTCRHLSYDPQYQHNANVQRLYGITADEYARLLQAQSGVCAICGDPPRGRCRLAVDHDHETNEVRGLLCAGCNNGLGRFRDDPVLLRTAADYLETHRDS